jgi:hypothetical protein
MADRLSLVARLQLGAILARAADALDAMIDILDVDDEIAAARPN